MNEGIYTRAFDVPAALLYKAWADPEHLKNWWGPQGFTNTFYEFDLQPGGKWNFTMHGPDGKDYLNESIFKEIVPGKRIVFDHLSAPEFRVEALFENDGSNSSLLTWKMIFKKEGLFESLKDFLAEKNEENLDRLTEELKKMI
ncbi:MAG: SRPBCC family protein [Ferruginibacter sp.]